METVVLRPRFVWGPGDQTLAPEIAAYGVTLGARSIPKAIARPAAAAIEATGRLLGLSSAPPLTRHAIDLMCCDCILDIGKIEKHLGYAPVVAVAECLRQLREREARSRP